LTVKYDPASVTTSEPGGDNQVFAVTGTRPNIRASQALTRLPPTLFTEREDKSTALHVVAANSEQNSD